MLFMFRRIWRDFPTWERPAQIGFVIALVLLVVAFILVLVAPQSERVQFLVAFGALMLVAQGIVLWANRGMIAPITQAQRAYMRGDFEEVIAVLEPIHFAGKAEITHLTLLGNTYRQMGRLDDSKRVLSEAIDKVPNHHYSLYGFGRTLIVEGHYAEGAQFIARALDAGAPAVVRFDLGEAYHRLGRWEEARSHLDALNRDEAHRALMADYWRYRAGEGAVPTVDLFYAGLPYWRAQAERFSETPYGQAVAEEVSQLLTLMDGEASDGNH
jgi:tetratricopeptide (TPR) repeat protein